MRKKGNIDRLIKKEGDGEGLKFGVKGNRDIDIRIQG